MGDVVIDGIVTDFVAVMKRIGALSDSDQEQFLDKLDNQPTLQDGEYIGGMEAISCYFEG